MDVRGGERGAGVDTFAEAEAIVDRFGPRPPGSDAERRAAGHLVGRLRDLGREAEVEPFSAWPGWPFAYAVHAGLGIAASVLAVSAAVPAAALALTAVVLTFLDASGVLPTTRRLLGRRSSQSVVSWRRRELPGALLLVAHYDSGPTGLGGTEAWRRRRARLERLIRRPIGPLAPLAWSLVAVLACCLLRVAGTSGTLLTVAQFVPTVVLIVAVPLLLDLALSAAEPGENDNASGVALALRLADRLEAEPPRHFGVHVILTGSQKAVAQGMRSFLRRHRGQLAGESTVVLNLDEVGDGGVRHTTREGPLFVLHSHRELGELCAEIAEDDEGSGSRPLVNRAASDGYAARSAGMPSLTVTCRDELGVAGRRLDEESLARAESFCLELIRRLDAQIGPDLAAAFDETVLSDAGEP
jgi:hypothetical protein